MEERRRAPRLQEENEVVITIVSGGNDLPEEKLIRNRSKDISASGARVQANLHIPVDTLLMLEMTLSSVRQMITVIGKVKWIKLIYEDDSYEVGVQFVNTAGDAVRKLQDYVLWKMSYNKTKSYP